MLNSDCDHDTMASNAKAWVGDFCSLYQTKHVTPYVHALAMHVPQFIELYGNLTKFTKQGLEKLNDLTTKHYLRSTKNKDKEMESLQQLILKRNRTLKTIIFCGVQHYCNQHNVLWVTYDL
jgi:hypothetical protein